MKFEKIQNMDVPDLTEIIKSGKKTQTDLNKIKDNKVDVEFYYSDMKFKSSTIGILSHIAGIPIVYINYPDELAFFIFEDSLIYDVNKLCFTLIVCENYIHTASFKNLINLDEIDIKSKELLERLTFKTPIKANMLEFDECFISDNNKDSTISKQIKLIPSYLSALGRSKLLERTIKKSNDALIVVAILGFLVGIISGIILTLLLI